MHTPGRASLLQAVRFDGDRLTLRLGNGLGAIIDGGEALAEFSRRAGLSPAVVNRIEVIFEEVLANIVRHGFEAGSVQSIRVELVADGDTVEITFDDDGIAFDPTRRPMPAPFTNLADAPIGGLGIPLVRRLAQSVDYAFHPASDEAGFDPVNRLVVRVATGARVAAGL